MRVRGSKTGKKSLPQQYKNRYSNNKQKLFLHLILHMFIFLKIILTLSFWTIVYQDFRERNVYLWVLLIAMFLIGFLHYQHSLLFPFLVNTSLNIGIICIIVAILYLYATFKLKQPLKNTFGFGDLLFFIAIAVGFPTITFVVLFSFSLFFSLLLFLVLKKKLKHQTVPLAGLQALFFSIIFLLNWSFNFLNFYQF